MTTRAVRVSEDLVKKAKTIQYLLADRFNEEQLELIMIGPHQNYYVKR